MTRSSPPDPFFHWSIQALFNGQWRTIQELDGLFDEALDLQQSLRRLPSTPCFTRVIQRGNPPDPTNRPFDPPE